MKLLVAEKPSVATGHYKTMLERCAGESFVKGDGYLKGKEYCITWCVGHLVTLAPFDEYEGYSGLWKLSNLPLIPDNFKLKAIERTTKQLQIVSSLMNEADELINGADAGREGNLIFDLILDKNPSFKQKIIKRLWVNSFVDNDLDRAFKNLEDAEKRINLSYAARLRQRADWLVGLNATRAYTLTAGRGKLISVGRVQTPTLNLVVNRDIEVEGFEELYFYGITATWRGYTAQWYEENKKAFHDTAAYPERVIKKCENKDAVIDSIKKSTKRNFPKKPFDLTELQKEANRIFKIKVARTLEIAQTLYESKFITYPRTDSAYLTEGMRDESYKLAQKLASPQELELFRKKSDKFTFINDKKVTDHFAIIPTDVVPNRLSDEERKVYSLVRERFITAWLKPQIWEEYQVVLLCEEEEFRMNLKKEIDLGFKIIEQNRKEELAKLGVNSNEPEADSTKNKDEDSESAEDGDDDSNDDLSNNISEDLTWKKKDAEPFQRLEINQKKKAKPQYFTEATLLAAMKTAGKSIEDEDLAEAMKDRGLGTPATQAGIIETLKSRGFIEEDKNKIKASEEGHRLIRLVDEQLKSPEMTGEWEYKLSQIEKGEYTPLAFKDDIVAYVKNIFKNLQNKFAHDFEREEVKPEFDCPKCKAQNNAQKLEIRNWGFVCPDDACGFKMGHTIAERGLNIEETKELLEKGELGEIDGFRSKRGFNFKAGLKMNSSFEVEFVFENQRVLTKRKEKCPRCKDELNESEKSISCKGGPHGRCNFVLFKKVAGYDLSEEEVSLLLDKKTTPLISAFKSKKGSDFSAKLSMDSNFKVVFEFEENKEGNAPKNKTNSTQYKHPCPRCQSRLIEKEQEIYCEEARCNLTIPKTLYKKILSPDELSLLIEKGQTSLIEGLVSPKGNTFAGIIYFDDKKELKLNWDLEINKALVPKND